MKKKHYTISEQEVEALIFALTIIPTLGYENTVEQMDFNHLSCELACAKLQSHDNSFTPREFGMISVAITTGIAIASGAISADFTTMHKCKLFLPLFKKLDSVFQFPSNS